MIVSKNWLAEYVELPASIDVLTSRLTMSGLNLEEFHDVRDGLSQPDVAIDLEVTSNRPDCLGHLGIAREVSVLFRKPLTIPPARIPQGDEAAASVTTVDVDAPDLCPEYHARVIRGVKIGPSPAWLRDRLLAVGINTVNNVVDVTNYVMLECGQPLHAFDFDRLQGHRIIVRRGRRGESITAIDQRSYDITDDMCVIADAQRPVAIAGVMGGFDSEISDRTTNVLIEAAAFAPMSVRATARALKLHSPSSYRFERKVDRLQLDWASRRCCELIQQVAGGTVLSGSVAAGQSPPAEETAITLRFGTVKRLLGIEIPPDTCIDILQRLGLKASGRDAWSRSFVPPSWRPDLRRECDLIEEIARIHGYEHVPVNATIPVIATCRTRREQVTDAVRSHLVASGLSEALTLSFVSDAQRRQFRPFGDLAPVSVAHSSRSHENQLRQSLIPSLLACRRQNERHGSVNAELFELARVYLSAGTGAGESAAEPMTIGIVAGRTFLQMKGLVESLVSRLAPGRVIATSPCECPEFAAGRGAVVHLGDELLGWIGELDRSLLDAAELQDAVVVAELRLPPLEAAYQAVRSFVPLPRFPSVSRDLNFVIPESVTWTQLVGCVRSGAGEFLHEVSFGGQYRGRQIDADCKSYVVGCRFQARDRTLTADEVDAAVRTIISSCETQLRAQLRA